MKFSIRSLMLCALLIAVVATVILRDQQRKRAAEAQIIVAFLVCDYLDANRSQWPPNWEALKPIHDARFPNETFEKLQNYVLLDFTIDGTALLETNVNAQLASDFKPIRSKSWHWQGYEEDPNLEILQHVGRIIMY